jgi:hypothetical protein
LSSYGFRGPELTPTPEAVEDADGQRRRRSLGQRFRDIFAREADKPLWHSAPKRVAAKVYWTSMKGFWSLQRSTPITFVCWKLHKIAGLKLPLWLNDRGFSSVDEAIEYLQGIDSKPTNWVEETLDRESCPHP